MEYKSGHANLVADTMSCKGEVVDISRPQSNLQDRIKEGLQYDSLTQTIIQLIKEGKTRRFWEEDDLILTKGKCIYAHSYSNIRREVMKECHHRKWTRHPGIHHTLVLVGDSYY